MRRYGKKTRGGNVKNEDGVRPKKRWGGCNPRPGLFVRESTANL